MRQGAGGPPTQSKNAPKMSQGAGGGQNKNKTDPKRAAEGRVGQGRGGRLLKTHTLVGQGRPPQRGRPTLALDAIRLHERIRASRQRVGEDIFQKYRSLHLKDNIGARATEG